MPILGLCSQGPVRVDGEECNGNQEDRDKLMECGKAQCWGREEIHRVIRCVNLGRLTIEEIYKVIKNVV